MGTHTREKILDVHSYIYVGIFYATKKKRRLQRHHGERGIESIHTTRKVRREKTAKRKNFFRE